MKSLQILLVDNEADVRGAIALLLGIDRHKVTQASGGAEALKLFDQGQFDLVITDYRMEEMMGDELAEKIKERHPEAKVIMVTGYAFGPPGPDSPVDRIIYKPCSLADLRKAISELLT